MEMTMPAFRWLLCLGFVFGISTVDVAVAAPPKLPIVAAAEAGFDETKLSEIDGLVEQAIREKKMPGCVIAIGRNERLVLLKAFGQRQIEPTPEAMTTDTLFDLASLTKPIATATSVMLLVERG